MDLTRLLAEGGVGVAVILALVVFLRALTNFTKTMKNGVSDSLTAIKVDIHSIAATTERTEQSHIRQEGHLENIERINVENGGSIRYNGKVMDRVNERLDYAIERQITKKDLGE